MTTTNDPKTYLPDEVAAMAEAGYIPAREAAKLYGVNISMAYRAIQQREVGGKTVAGPVRGKLGANNRSKYIHKADWVKYMEARRRRIAEANGLRV